MYNNILRFWALVNSYLPNGIFESIFLDFSGSAQARLPNSLKMTVGLIALTLIPYWPSSNAMTRVIESTAPLDEAYATWSFIAAWLHIRLIFISFSLYSAHSRVGRLSAEFWSHCVLSGRTERRALPRYQSEEI